MGQAMSTATRLWIFIAALNSTQFLCAYVASITAQDHPLLYRSQQLWTDSKVDTTLVAYCICSFSYPCFSTAQYTVKLIPISYSRTSSTCRIVNNFLTFRFRDNHACNKSRSYLFPSMRFLGIAIYCATVVLQAMHFS